MTQPAQPPRLPRVYYKVESIRESLVGDKINTADLENLLNTRAAEGWVLNTTVRAPVKGRVGPGGAEAVILIFEWQHEVRAATAAAAAE